MIWLIDWLRFVRWGSGRACGSVIGQLAMVNGAWLVVSDQLAVIGDR